MEKRANQRPAYPFLSWARTVIAFLRCARGPSRVASQLLICQIQRHDSGFLFHLSTGNGSLLHCSHPTQIATVRSKATPTRWEPSPETQSFSSLRTHVYSRTRHSQSCQFALDLIDGCSVHGISESMETSRSRSAKYRDINREELRTPGWYVASEVFSVSAEECCPAHPAPIAGGP